MNNKLKSISNVDIIFISACDHNEGTNNHGLFQMFDFFRKNINKKSIFASTQSSLYSNNIDVFDISKLGGYIPLANQVNITMMNGNSPHSWIKSVDAKNFQKLAAKILINNLPKHKLIVVADKVEIDFSILEIVLRHFDSKLLIISAVNNTWTGLCSYPKEFNCEKYKTEIGCTTDCPALRTHTRFNQQFVTYNYNSTASFIKNNPSIIYLNVGNKFSYEEAEESFLFRNVKKSIIPLKNMTTKKAFSDVWLTKTQNKKLLINFLNTKYDISDVDYLIMWSAHSMEIKRKGMDYLIDAMYDLKSALGDEFGKICLIICARQSSLYNEKLNQLGIKYANIGFLDREQYNKVLSGSDLYCSTTISDAGPRTTYEAAALATPIISFDFCNAADFVNKENGALVDTYDVKLFAKEMKRLFSERQNTKTYSEQIYKTFNELMDTERLVKKWNTFFQETLMI